LILQKLLSICNSESFRNYFLTFHNVDPEFRRLLAEISSDSSFSEDFDLIDFEVLTLTDLSEFTEPVDLYQPLKSMLPRTTGVSAWEVKIPPKMKALLDPWLAVVNFSITAGQIAKTLTECDYKLTHESCQKSAELKPEMHKNILQYVLLWEFEYLQKECNSFAEECWKLSYRKVR
jgi:hypothetical protein